MLGNPPKMNKDNLWSSAPWRPLVQLEFLLEIRDLLQRRLPAEQSLDCYAQDSGYTEHDLVYLKGKGIQASLDLEGFLKVDDKTLVISFFLPSPLYYILGDICKLPPAVFITNIVWTPANRKKHNREPLPERSTGHEAGRESETLRPDDEAYPPYLPLRKAKRSGIIECSRVVQFLSQYEAIDLEDDPFFSWSTDMYVRK